MEPSAIDRAKKSISSAEPLSAWIGPRPQFTSPQTESKSFTIGEQTFVDRCPRLPLENYLDDTHGDSLPQHPAVLLNVCSDWDCFSPPWTISTLSSIVPSTPLSLDGGPGFARGSICFGSVTLPEYARYCKEDAAKDSAPLYVFDHRILSTLSSSFSIPACFSNDVLAGDPRRALPPAWLLVGAEGSGTPIHDHPTTIAWNALLSGCKVWVCFPPDIDESFLLLNLDGENDGDKSVDSNASDDFDLSAIEWFSRCRDLPEGAEVIIQWPGEVVFLPEGWWHVVLNAQESVAISYSIQLRRFNDK
ncbi:hypothetical protein TrVE_jg8286 [Triparma verrucosa]|uniref:JmjC domain-containing protein n=1 Tax=Triparma verrucosa TaxID=1606542 RepID=A0A9W6Z8G0_9STRA|nr:hypothetical protein TrVE_jg8286 [Triparma verrucosa]